MWLIRLIGALVVLAALIVVGLLLLPGDRVAAIVADQVEARTGRQLEISGDVRVTLWPVLGVRTGPVRLGNPDWAGSDPMLTAEGLSVAVSAPALLKGALRVREVTVRRPDLRLQVAADGRTNWDFGVAGSDTAKPDASTQEVATSLSVDVLRLTDARFSYAAAGADPVLIAVDELELRWPGPDAPMQIESGARPFGDPVRVSATISRPADLIAGDVSPVGLSVSAPGGTARFDGRVDTGGDAAGQLSLQVSDTARLLAALGQPGAAPPAGLGRSVDVSTGVTYTSDQRLSLRDLTVQLDGNRLTGAADIVLGTPANVVARLSADSLDLRPLSDAGGDNGSARAGTGWPDDPIDASALGLANGTLHLTANRVETAAATLSGLDAKLRLDRSRAVLSLQPVTVFGGALQGEFVANNRNGLSVAGKARASGIEMRQMLEKLAGITRLSGKAEGEIDVLGAGQSVDAIMHSLKGQGGLRMRQGVISGIDLDQLLRTGTGTGGTTVFDNLSATYTITAGDLHNDDLRLQLAHFNAEGAGRIGLGAQDIDYLFTPVALDRGDGKRLAISVRVKGPWSGPRIIPDLSDALDAEIGAKREELEQRATDAARQKLEQELDTDIGTRDDAEKAIRKKLEDEAKKGLLKLLGDN